MAEIVTDEPGLFDTARDAIVFAFNHSNQCYDRPIMNRLAAPSPLGGRGLGGVDGAAQAGMILLELQGLGDLDQAIITARCAPRTLPGTESHQFFRQERANRIWTSAITYLASHVRTAALGGCTSDSRMRHEYVIRYFSTAREKISFEELAETYGFHRQTVSAHANRVARYFGGPRVRRNGDDDIGAEGRAMARLEDQLQARGIVKA